MISVTISINGKPLYHRTAINVSPEGARSDEQQEYHVDTGEKIKHIPDRGAVALAKVLLKTIDEQK